MSVEERLKINNSILFENIPIRNKETELYLFLFFFFSFSSFTDYVKNFLLNILIKAVFFA